MGWIIAIGVLALIAILPVGVSVFYDEEGLRAFLTAGPARFSLYPSPEKEKKQVKPKKKQPVKQKKPTAKPKQNKKGGSLQDFLPLVDKLLDFLGAFGRKLRVKCLELKWILAGDDPADLAVNYGKAWAALGNLMPLLEQVLTIRKCNVEVECDFSGNQTTVIARCDISITVGRVILLLVAQGIPVLREFLKIMNKRKGGAKA